MKKLKFSSGLPLGVILLTLSIQAKADLMAGQILEKLQANYASAVSYSDDGQTFVSIGGETNRTTFSIRLARPNFYQIAWMPLNNGSNPQNVGDVQMLWSAGAGNFLQTGPDINEEPNRTVTLADASGPSGGLTSVLPRLFFSDTWPDFTNDGIPVAGHPNEKINQVDCYVVSWIYEGQETTLWIGVDDFLIHQVRRTTDANTTRSVLENTRFDFNLISAVQAADLLSFTVTETHNHILLNREFSSSDFSPFK